MFGERRCDGWRSEGRWACTNSLRVGQDSEYVLSRGVRDRFKATWGDVGHRRRIHNNMWFQRGRTNYNVRVLLRNAGIQLLGMHGRCVVLVVKRRHRVVGREGCFAYAERIVANAQMFRVVGVEKV